MSTDDGPPADQPAAVPNINPKRRTGNFTRIGNELLRKKSLSFKARGILCHLLSHRPDWEVRMSELKGSVDREASVRSGIEELIAAGHVTRERVRDKSGAFTGWRYRVFEEPIAETRNSSIGTETRFPTRGFPTRGFPTRGFSSAKKTSAKKTINKKTSSKNASSVAEATDEGSPGAEPSPSGVPSEGAGTDSRVLEEAPAGSRGIPFPWAEVMRIFAAKAPEIRRMAPADKRNFAMQAFWRRHGRRVEVFETLCQRIAESDYCMGRNGHPGDGGKPHSWGWVFSKDSRGRLRADLLIDGDMTNEKMSWLPEKLAREKQQEAKAKLTKVVVVGVREPKMIDLGELKNGKPRWRNCGECDFTGLPLVMEAV